MEINHSAEALMFLFRSHPRRPSRQPAPARPAYETKRASFAVSNYELEIAEFCTWAANQAGFGCPATKGDHAAYVVSMLKKYPKENRIRYWASRLGVRLA